jgi:hypothetical protein
MGTSGRELFAPTVTTVGISKRRFDQERLSLAALSKEALCHLVIIKAVQD